MVARVLPAPLVGVLTVLLMTVILLVCTAALLVPLAIKAALPLPLLRHAMTRWMVAVGDGWVAANHHLYTLLHGRRRRYRFEGEVDRRRSWLLISNHQSWADILILFDALHGRAPFARFFLKRELIWVPIIGPICWGFDMPFMKRHSQEAVAANPALRNEDLDATRRFCARLRGQAITVINFLEGTRFTPAKRDARGAPYRNLLRPKSAGLSFTLNAMGEQFAGILDVTIAYVPDTRTKLWSFACGGQRDVAVLARVLPLPADLIHGDYQDDPAFRARFQKWVNALWEEKDERLAVLSSAAQAQRGGAR